MSWSMARSRGSAGTAVSFHVSWTRDGPTGRPALSCRSGIVGCRQGQLDAATRREVDLVIAHSGVGPTSTAYVPLGSLTRGPPTDPSATTPPRASAAVHRPHALSAD